MEKQEKIGEILYQFKYKIKKSLGNTPYQEREDLEQEIKAKIIEKVNDVEFEEPEGFWSLLKK